MKRPIVNVAVTVRDLANWNVRASKIESVRTTTPGIHDRNGALMGAEVPFISDFLGVIYLAFRR